MLHCGRDDITENISHRAPFIELKFLRPGVSLFDLHARLFMRTVVLFETAYRSFH